ncbi:hypothetical protein LguiA_011497 [Lonicera macranthoides]
MYNWHSFHEEAFILLIEEEFDMGRMGLNTSLSAKQVNEISQKLKERTGRYFDVAQIRAKFARMKAKTIAFHKLINSTGFGWSAETNTVTADENVRSTYLKVNTRFEPKQTQARVFLKRKVCFVTKHFSKSLKRASIQGPLYSDEEMDVGGGPSMFPMDAAYVYGSGAKCQSSKRSKTSLDVLMETMSETSRTKKAHYDAKAISAEEHTMIDYMSVLKNMPVFGVQYGLTAERLISRKDWCSFFLLLNPDWQLE